MGLTLYMAKKKRKEKENKVKEKKKQYQVLTEMWNNRNSNTLLVRMQNCTTNLKTVWWYIIQLTVHLAFNPAVPLLDIYSDEMKTSAHTFIYNYPKLEKQNKINVFQLVNGYRNCGPLMDN